MTREQASGRCRASGLEVCWLSDVGPFRDNNEDACLARPAQGLLAVADGMGGELAGEVASRLTVEWLPDMLTEQLARMSDGGPVGAQSAVHDALVALNHRLRVECSSMDGVYKMGATIALALVCGPLAHIANMGDSRAYLFSSGKLERLTKDHSVVGTLLERGAITREQASCHSMRGQVARYLGMGGEARPDQRTVELGAGDWLMLCTDGLTDAVADEDIGAILTSADGLSAACRALIEAAKAGASRDNITVLIAEWRPSDRAADA